MFALELKQKIDRAIGSINGKFGRIGWTPVVYQYRHFSLHPLAAAYAVSDVALVTPLRDGMNLIAKEYVACCVDEKGVLILSEMAGAAAELGEALLVNPNNRQEIADAIHTALEMPPEEQQRRLRAMRRRVAQYDVVRWADDFLQSLEKTWRQQQAHESIIVTGSLRDDLINGFLKSNRRLILSDYDGTLVGFHKDPAQAGPSPKVINLLQRISALPNTSLALVSGRIQETMEQWFGNLTISLASEHGAYVRHARDVSGKWRRLGTADISWKEDLRPVLEFAAQRLPGAFVEEKHLSLAWHWRAAEPELGKHRALELIDTLYSMTGNREVQVLQGNKVVELRCGDVNKGVAGLHFISQSRPDFILAVGDDWTDEDLFRAMPDYAYTLKVGPGRSAARMAVHSFRDVISILESITLSEEQIKNQTVA